MTQLKPDTVHKNDQEQSKARTNDSHALYFYRTRPDEYELLVMGDLQCSV